MVARIPNSAALAASSMAWSSGLPDGGLERIHHRLVPDRRGAEVFDRGERSRQDLDKLRTVERRLVTEDAPAAAERRAPQRPAGATHGGDQRAAREDEQLPRRRAAVRVKGLNDGLESPNHVGAVVSVADRRVELDQMVALGANGDFDLEHP
jgi:hypothetical protein